MELQDHAIFLVDTAGISMRFSDDVPGAQEAAWTGWEESPPISSQSPKAAKGCDEHPEHAPGQ